MGASDQSPIWIFDFHPCGQLRAVKGKMGKIKTFILSNFKLYFFMFSWAKK